MATQQSRYMIVTGLVVLTLFVYLIYLTNDIIVPGKVHPSSVSYDHKVNKPETAKLTNSERNVGDQNIKNSNDLSGKCLIECLLNKCLFDLIIFFSERLNSSNAQFSYNVMPSEIVKALNASGGKIIFKFKTFYILFTLRIELDYSRW